jgi:hypothetical protein
MFQTSVTLSYSGQSYTFAQDVEKVIKGKLGCDCTKSLLIRDYCNPDFPALECGQQIEVVALVEVEAEPAAVLH